MSADKSKLILTTIDDDGVEVPFGGGDPFAVTLPKKNTVVCVTLNPLTGAEIPIPGAGPKGDKGVTGETGETGAAGADGIFTEAVALTPSGAGIIDLNNVLTALSAAGLIAVDTATAQAELAKVTDVAVATVPNGTANTKAGVEAAMLLLANALVAANYVVTIGAGSTYDDATSEWEGVFVVTKDTTPLNTAADEAARSITITILAE